MSQLFTDSDASLEPTHMLCLGIWAKSYSVKFMFPALSGFSSYVTSCTGNPQSGTFGMFGGWLWRTERDGSRLISSHVPHNGRQLLLKKGIFIKSCMQNEEINIKAHSRATALQSQAVFNLRFGHQSMAWPRFSETPVTLLYKVPTPPPAPLFSISSQQRYKWYFIHSSVVATEF